MMSIMKNEADEKDRIIREQAETIQKMQGVIQALTEEIARLRSQMATNSRNSSKPPSSDGPGKPAPKNLRKPTGKKPGAQKLHKGSGLRLPHTPDETIEHEPAECTGCARVGDCTQGVCTEHRYVVDIHVQTQVIEHRSISRACMERNGEILNGVFPQGCGSTLQYGEGIAALAIALNTHGMVSLERIHEILGAVFNVPISVGTIAAFVQRCAQAVKPGVEKIKEAVQGLTIAHFDETGFRVEGKNLWIHSASDEKLTYMSVERQRGKGGMDTSGVLTEFKGIAVHDCWSPYFIYTAILHALCNVHILRDLLWVTERTAQEWAGKVVDVLMRMKAR
jgi:transposase